jgi:hypothetical protein
MSDDPDKWQPHEIAIAVWLGYMVTVFLILGGTAIGVLIYRSVQ